MSKPTPEVLERVQAGFEARGESVAEWARTQGFRAI